jgi:hypothetical protein
MVDLRKLKAELYRIIIGVKYVGCEMKFARDLRQLAAELGQVVLGDAAGPGDVDDASFDGVCRAWPIRRATAGMVAVGGAAGDSFLRRWLR